MELQEQALTPTQTMVFIYRLVTMPPVMGTWVHLIPLTSLPCSAEALSTMVEWLFLPHTIQMDQSWRPGATGSLVAPRLTWQMA
jgi:hypothetical protein